MAYPTTLDSFTNLSPTDPMDGAGKEGDTIVNAIYAALTALETKVGVNSSAVSGTVDYRLAALEARPTGSASLNVFFA